MGAYYNIDSKTYEKLYAKYLQGNRTIEMVDLAGDLKGKNVLDFCCGGCRLSKEVLKRKPERITAVDESFLMLQPMEPDSCIHKICWSVDGVLNNITPGVTHAIFCQQGINYWFHPEHAKLIKKALAPKGVFIFNTFNVRPSVIPLVKNYEKTGRNYVEISWLAKKAGQDMVKHVQVTEGMDPHFTEFRWIPPNEFKLAFKRAGFKVTVHTNNSTDVYICRKG